MNVHGQDAKRRVTREQDLSKAIEFSDPEVKRICVEIWDTDGDGELSYGEAGGVDDIGDFFSYTDITSFDELQFFTGLTRIGEYAFYLCTELTSVSLPEQIEVIEEYAFGACDLRSLYIPENVSSIGINAFYHNTALNGINVNESNQTFDSRDNCNAIIRTADNTLIQGCNSTVIPEGVRTLRDHSFEDLILLRKMHIPEGVVDLGEGTFFSCHALEELSIPSTVSSDGIHDETFLDCPNLRDIYCYIKEPAPLPSEGIGPFECSGNEYLVYEQAILHVPAGTKAKYEAIEGWNLFINIVEMEGDFSQDGLSCPDSHHPHLIDLGLPSGTKWACCNVDTDHPENQSPTNYGGHYGWGEIGVKGSYYIYDYAYYDMDEDNFIYIGEHIGNTNYDVAHKAWKGEWRMPTDEECEELLSCVQEETTINGVKGLKFIGPNDNSIFLPYAGYRYEMDLSYEGSVGWYWTDTYSDVQWAKSFTIPLSMVADEPREVGHSVRPVVGGDAMVPDLIQFADAEVKKICVENWDTDGDGELSYYEAEEVEDIGTVFRSTDITSFDELEYFTGLKTIGERAFSSCENLTSITFPISLETIYSYAFNGCNLLSLNIPENVSYIHSYAFDNNRNLNEIKVDENNPYYDSRDNCNAIIETASNTLVKGCNSTVIPEGIKTLGWSAFEGLEQLKTIHIPEGVTDLGDYTFYGCTALEELSIPSTVSSGGFHYTTFYDCFSLKNIYCYIQNPEALPHLSSSPGPFGTNPSPETQVYEQAILHVPAGTKAKYEATEGWNLFTHIEEMDGSADGDVFTARTVEGVDVTYKVINKEEKTCQVGVGLQPYDGNGRPVIPAVSTATEGRVTIPETVNGFTVTTVAGDAFSGCSSIYSISLPQTIVEIGENAMRGCNALTNINIPKNVKTLGSAAFCWCTSLETITIPRGVTSIGSACFQTCRSLRRIYCEIVEPFDIDDWMFKCYDEAADDYLDSPIYTDATLYVPAGSKALYENTQGWNMFSHIEEMGDNQIVMERKYLVNSTSNQSYCYPFANISLNNRTNIEIQYHNAYYWNGSWDGEHVGIFVTVRKEEQSEEWYIAPRVNNEWVNEKITVSGDGKVEYYMNGQYMGSHYFNLLSFDGASNLILDFDPYGWWTSHIHYMDDLTVRTPAGVITDDFNDAVLDPDLWQTPVNPDGVREEDGILKMEQLRTDQDFHLRSLPIPLVSDMPTDGMVAYYPFNGTADDKSGNGNHGSPTSSVTLTKGVQGDYNGAYLFGGYDNPGHIFVPNSESLQFSEGATFSFYMKPTSWESMDGWGSKTSQDGVQCLLAKEHDRRGITFEMAGNDGKCHIWMGSMDGESWAEVDSKDLLDGNFLNRWTHVAFVYGNGHAQLYIDGKLIDDRASTPDFSRMNQLNMYIGKFSDSWYPYNGAIDEVRIYSRALSAAEIRSLARYSETNVTPDLTEAIQFADAKVKTVCVQMWDTNGDGELSYAEAAEVTEITGIFSGKDITSFDELQYFTKVTDPGDFRSCTKLTSIVLPPSIETIHHSAFKDCSSLKAIRVPAKVREIQWYAFQGCYSLPAIEVDEANPYFRAVDGVLFSKDMTQLVIYPDGKLDTSYQIPEGVTTILEYAFLENNSIEAVHIPASVSDIVRASFVYNSNLSSFHVDENSSFYRSLDGVLFDKDLRRLVRYPTGRKDAVYQVPEHVVSTGEGAFTYAGFLEQVSFSQSFERIMQSSFSNCPNLTTVVLANSLCYIGDWAFFQSPLLQKVISYVQNPFEINENTFKNVNSETEEEFTSATLYVPYGTKNLYETTTGWNLFANIVEMELLEPFDVQLENPDTWNELSQPVRLIIKGKYLNMLENKGVIEYEVENSGQWAALTGSLLHGESFNATIETQFDPSSLIHVINFREVDTNGLIIPLETLEYYDVNNFTLQGIKDMVYTGNPIYQDELSCEVAEFQWTTSYSNNVDAGRATVNLEGVFPYTVGRKPFYFNILPQPFTGGITVVNDDLVFNGQRQQPEWKFTNETLNALTEGTDYRVEWENNFLPGTATLTVKGKGNYEGTLTATFTISKAPVTDNLYSIVKPASEINYDGEGHGVEVHVKDYVGMPTVTYVSADGTYNSTEKPVNGGEYDAYLEIAEGEGYLAMERVLVASFVIYQVADDVWAALQRINNKLGETASRPWDFSEGMKSVFSQPGLAVEKGLVTKISLAGKAFTGQIPDELFWLPDLQRLDLSGNQFEGEVASQLNTFMNDGGSLAPHLTYIDISGNRLTGNIGAFAANFDELQTLHAHDNGFSTVDPMISPAVSTLTLGAQHISDVTAMSVADLVGPSFIEMLPTVITYNHGRQTYENSINMLLVSGLPSETDASTWGMQVNVTDGVVKLNKYGNHLDYHGENGATLYLATGVGSQNHSWLPVKLSFERGDANFSGDVNVLDLQSVINYIFAEYQKLFNYTAADLKTDENINLLDVIGMVNTLMDMDLPTQIANHAAKMEAGEETESAVYCDNGMLYLTTSRPVAAFDIFVSNCRTAEIIQTLETAGMSCTARELENGIHIIGYSMNGAVLPEGTTAIARLTGGSPLVAHAMLSDQDAEEIPVLLNQDVTGLIQLASNMEVRANAEGIVLMTKKNLTHVTWSLYSLDGNLVDRGELDNIAAGQYLLHPRADLRNLTWIVRVTARGEKEITKKINIR